MRHFIPLPVVFVVPVCPNAARGAGRCFLTAVQRGIRFYGKTDTPATVPTAPRTAQRESSGNGCRLQPEIAPFERAFDPFTTRRA
jgi:hypothetical protein